MAQQVAHQPAVPGLEDLQGQDDAGEQGRPEREQRDELAHGRSVRVRAAGTGRPRGRPGRRGGAQYPGASRRTRSAPPTTPEASRARPHRPAWIRAARDPRARRPAAAGRHRHRLGHGHGPAAVRGRPDPRRPGGPRDHRPARRRGRRGLRRAAGGARPGAGRVRPDAARRARGDDHPGPDGARRPAAHRRHHRRWSPAARSPSAGCRSAGSASTCPAGWRRCCPAWS